MLVWVSQISVVDRLLGDTASREIACLRGQYHNVKDVTNSEGESNMSKAQSNNKHQ